MGVPYFTAYKALIMGAQAKPGETVLIHGASGAVGTAAVQIARSMGVIVVGTAGTKVLLVDKTSMHVLCNTIIYNTKNGNWTVLEARFKAYCWW